MCVLEELSYGFELFTGVLSLGCMSSSLESMINLSVLNTFPNLLTQNLQRGAWNLVLPSSC
jgi:hypothetical protein